MRILKSLNTTRKGGENLDVNLSEIDTSKITDMSYMFVGAKSFNQPLDKWDANKVTDLAKSPPKWYKK